MNKFSVSDVYKNIDLACNKIREKIAACKVLVPVLKPDSPFVVVFEIFDKSMIDLDFLLNVFSVSVNNQASDANNPGNGGK